MSVLYISDTSAYCVESAEAGMTLCLRRHLNCLDQRSPELVSSLAAHYLQPPSRLHHNMDLVPSPHSLTGPGLGQYNQV